MWAMSPCCSTALRVPGTSVGTARMLGSGAQVRQVGWALRLDQASFPGLRLGALTPAHKGASSQEGACAGLREGGKGSQREVP